MNEKKRLREINTILVENMVGEMKRKCADKQHLYNMKLYIKNRHKTVKDD